LEWLLIVFAKGIGQQISIKYSTCEHSNGATFSETGTFGNEQKICTILQQKGETTCNGITKRTSKAAPGCALWDGGRIGKQKRQKLNDTDMQKKLLSQRNTMRSK